MCAKSRMRGDKSDEVISMKFGTPIDIHNVITLQMFGAIGRRVGRGGGQIFPFSIGLSGRPYNTSRTTEPVINKQQEGQRPNLASVDTSVFIASTHHMICQCELCSQPVTSSANLHRYERDAGLLQRSPASSCQVHNTITTSLSKRF